MAQAVLDQPLPQRLTLAGSARRGKTLVLVTGIPLALLLLVVIIAPVLPLPDANAQSVQARLLPPAFFEGGVGNHLLGTDHLGRDVAARLVDGARLTLIIAFGAVAVAATLGTALGLCAGYMRGRMDAVISRLVEAQLSIPFMLLAIAVLTSVGRSIFVLVLVLSLAGWANYARIIRGDVLALRVRPFVTALRAAGVPTRRIIVRHMLPNVFGTFTVLATLEVGAMVLAEGAVSFLGVGVVSPDISWGAMLAEGRSRMDEAWWLVVLPGLAITVTVVLVNLLGDGLRTLLDPKARSW